MQSIYGAAANLKKCPVKDIEQNSPAPDLLILNVSVVHLNTNVLSMNQFFHGRRISGA